MRQEYEKTMKKIGQDIMFKFQDSKVKKKKKTCEDFRNDNISSKLPLNHFSSVSTDNTDAPASVYLRIILSV